MVTTETWQRRALFRSELRARLLIDILYHYRGSTYLLHEFVIMPDHIHVLITPNTSLEKAVQFIKGGFSYRSKKELGSSIEIWQKGFQDRRIRDAADYDVHLNYIRQNPVRKKLCERAEDYTYSSAHAAVGAPEGAPLQSNSEQSNSERGPAESLHDKVQSNLARLSPLQSKNRIA